MSDPYVNTDKEKVAEAASAFQKENGLDDAATMALWEDDQDPRRSVLEKCIFDAVNANDSVKGAQELVPGGVSLLISSEDA